MNRRRNTRLLIGLIVCLLVLNPRSGVAQVDIEIIPKEPEYTFGEVINFNASLNSVAGVEEVLLYIQSSEESDLQIHPVSIESFGNLFVQVDLHEFPLNGFSKVEYWYQINTDHGDTYASPRNTFTYLDNRYQWQSLAGEPFTIHWYEGDLAFGEEVLNVALESLRSTQDILEVFFPDSMDIYVYESPQAMQVALPKGGQHWIAGHADPFQSVILVSLPAGPEQRLEMERQIPHELMHIALNYTDSHAYSNLPAWFNEGLASQVELYPNPEYQILMDRAFESDQLIPLASLCESFPNDPQRGLLAYAQSASFTLYLYEQYGQPGFNRLMAAYASGMSCERGVAEALGTTLTRLEASWLRENFTDLTIARTYEQYIPWLALLLVIISGPIIVAVTFIRRRPTRTEI